MLSGFDGAAQRIGTAWMGNGTGQGRQPRTGLQQPLEAVGVPQLDCGHLLSRVTPLFLRRQHVDPALSEQCGARIDRTTFQQHSTPIRPFFLYCGRGRHGCPDGNGPMEADFDTLSDGT